MRMALDRQTVPIHVYSDTRERMQLLLDIGERKRQEVEQDERWIGRFDRSLSSEDRLDIRVEFEEHVRQLRRDGEMLDTIDAVVEHAARTALAERGWDRPWPRAPKQARLRGRWPGSRVSGAPKLITPHLDPELAEQVLGACWWNSIEAMQQVRRLRDENPGLMDGTELAKYSTLSRNVTTTGDLYRAGLGQILPQLPPQMLRPQAS